GVPGPSAVVVVAPGDRVVVPHGVAADVVGGLVQRGQHVDPAPRVVPERVPLVRPLPLRGQVVGRGVGRVLDDDGRRRSPGRVAGEVGADEAAVPGPVVLGVARGVDAGVAATVLDVLLERRLLLVVEDVTGRREPDDDVVLGEVLGGEGTGVLGGVDGEAVLLAQLLDRRDPRGDGVVAERGGLGEDQGAELGVVGGWWLSLCAGTTGGERQDEGTGEQRARGPYPPPSDQRSTGQHFVLEIVHQAVNG